MTAPRFTTSINATGPDGNIFVVLGAARSMMKRLKVPVSDIDAMTLRVMRAGSYSEALTAIREWFPVDDGEPAP